MCRNKKNQEDIEESLDMEVKLDIRDNKLSNQSKDLVKIDLVKETRDI